MRLLFQQQEFFAVESATSVPVSFACIRSTAHPPSSPIHSASDLFHLEDFLVGPNIEAVFVPNMLTVNDPTNRPPKPRVLTSNYCCSHLLDEGAILLSPNMDPFLCVFILHYFVIVDQKGTVKVHQFTGSFIPFRLVLKRRKLTTRKGRIYISVKMSAKIKKKNFFSQNY